VERIPKHTSNAPIVPMSQEAEMCVLGSLILDGEEQTIYPDILPFLKPDDFFILHHKMIYRAIQSLYEERKPIDGVMLLNELEARKTEVPAQTLSDILQSVPSFTNGKYYADTVLELSQRRALIRQCDKTLKTALDEATKTTELIGNHERDIFQISQRRLTQTIVPVKDTVHDLMMRLNDPNRKPMVGIPTGFEEYDTPYGGLHPGELVIVAGRPSMGKSALSLNIAEYLLNEDFGVLLFSVEMRQEEIVKRLLSQRSGISYYAIHNEKVNPEAERGRLADFTNWIQDRKFVIVDTPQMQPTEILSISRTLKHKHDIRLVILDYLQLLTMSGYHHRNDEIASISRQMKLLARELDIPVIVVSQLNRQLENREDKRPQMADLRESGAIEQDADVILFLYREDYYKKKQKGYTVNNEVELIVAKHRNGPTSTIPLQWQGGIMRFDNLAIVGKDEK